MYKDELTEMLLLAQTAQYLCLFLTGSKMKKFDTTVYNSTLKNFKQSVKKLKAIK